MWDFPLFPEQASTIAWEVDTLYFVLIALSAIIALGVMVFIVYFAVKYRRGSDADRSNPPAGNLKVEVIWTIIPTVLGTAVFVWAAASFFSMRQPPPGNMLEISVIGKQWMWKFQHPSGAREINTLHLPVGQPVRLTMTSQDVIHSFYVPAFRVKRDVFPGRYVTLWFTPTKPGRYRLFCTEYCGTEHSFMDGWVYVMRRTQYEQWLRTGSTGGSNTAPGTGRYERTPTGGATEQGFDAGATDAPLRAGPFDQAVPLEESVGGAEESPTMVQAGAALFQALRCVACHRVDSSALYPAIGPNLDDVYGRPVELQNNRTIIADAQYLRASILNPQAKLVAGYPPVMPTFKGQISEAELMELIAYLKSLSGEAPPPPLAPPPDTTGAPPADTAGATSGVPPLDATGTAAASLVAAGEALFRQLACTTCHRVDPQANVPRLGPLLHGLYGSEETLQSGRTVTVDDAYLRESILHPQAKVVADYAPVMPSYAAQLSEGELNSLLAYIKSLH